MALVADEGLAQVVGGVGGAGEAHLGVRAGEGDLVLEGRLGGDEEGRLRGRVVQRELRRWAGSASVWGAVGLEMDGLEEGRGLTRARTDSGSAGRGDEVEEEEEEEGVGRPVAFASCCWARSGAR